MAGELQLARVEGGLRLVQDDAGHIRVPALPPRDFERRLLGRGPLDAVHLVQQISADAGVSHAQAALLAWEQAGALAVAENGRAVREILHSLAMAHAHVRQFYVDALPDYLPWSTLADYGGADPRVLHLRDGVGDRPRGDWSRQGFEHPFSAAEVDRLWEHRSQALGQLTLLQRTLALLGGKYPITMSLVPGGVNLALRESALLRLRGYLAALRGFIEDTALADGLLVVGRYPALKGLGHGVPDFLSAGSGEDEAALEGALFPSGILLNDRLEPFSAVATESIAHAYYEIPPQGVAPGVASMPQPGKADAYSWIKAPRYQGRPMEVGAYARLVITYLSGTRMAHPEFVDEMEKLLGGSIRRSNTVAGRMLARLAELSALLERADALLDQVDPAHPAVAAETDPFTVTGEGLGLVEGPAGTVQHRVILEHGRIVHYDVVAAGTWNGASEDKQNLVGSLEAALNRAPADLGNAAQRRTLSRIVHSFAFSAVDAVH